MGLDLIYNLYFIGFGILLFVIIKLISDKRYNDKKIIFREHGEIRDVKKIKLNSRDLVDAFDRTLARNNEQFIIKNMAIKITELQTELVRNNFFDSNLEDEILYAIKKQGLDKIRVFDNFITIQDNAKLELASRLNYEENLWFEAHKNRKT